MLTYYKKFQVALSGYVIVCVFWSYRSIIFSTLSCWKFMNIFFVFSNCSFIHVAVLSQCCSMLNVRFNWEVVHAFLLVHSITCLYMCFRTSPWSFRCWIGTVWRRMTWLAVCRSPLRTPAMKHITGTRWWTVLANRSQNGTNWRSRNTITLPRGSRRTTITNPRGSRRNTITKPRGTRRNTITKPRGRITNTIAKSRGRNSKRIKKNHQWCYDNTWEKLYDTAWH